MRIIPIGTLLALLLSFQPPSAGAVPPAEPSQNQLLDLDGHPVHPLEESAARTTVLVFVRTDCPLSNRYAPVLNALYDQYSSRGVSFWLVYVDPHQTSEQVRHHVAQYRFRTRVVLDPHHRLVHQAHVNITPEAAVFVGSDLVYRGRIDNRNPELGVTLPHPTRNDLDLTLAAILSHQPVPETTTKAVGCYISDLE
jgi:ribosomal protein L35AE/L33A